ncbi:MAG: ATP-binding protein [Candidatus Margulisbacteria bacterium]|nr:ATP-binding protein [Candidatus Margulisiibacteriota bacterium]
MKIAVASGKGGTGKTLISTNIFNILSDAIYLDCDVEEPNGHIFLKTETIRKESVYIPVPEINESKCVFCGRCSQVCNFNAIIVARRKVLVFPELCHGCGSCAYFCNKKAIVETPKEVGRIETGIYKGKWVYTGRLNIGEPMSPPVIKKLKEKAAGIDTDIILDSPPGTSCPVIETISGADYVILVTEPTPFGLNDLKLAVNVVRKLKLPLGIVINKSDLGDSTVKKYCKKEKIKLLLEIPHDIWIAESYSRGELITDTEKFAGIFKKLFKDIRMETI